MNFGTRVTVLESNLIKVVSQQLNMCLKLLPSPKCFESLENIIGAMVSKKIYIALVGFGTNSLSLSYFNSTNIYFMMSVSWYVPCSVKNPTWSIIFRILSVDRL